MDEKLGLDLPNLLYFIGKSTFNIEFKKGRSYTKFELLDLAEKKFKFLKEVVSLTPKEDLEFLTKEGISTELWNLLFILLTVCRKIGVSDLLLREKFKKTLSLLKNGGKF